MVRTQMPTRVRGIAVAERGPLLVPSWWSHAGIGPTNDVSSAAAHTWQATATASATPHAKGAWQSVIAALTADCYALSILVQTVTLSTGVDSSMLMDIGVGAGPTIVVSDIPWGHGNSTRSITFPIFIAKGSQIQFRIQSAIVSAAAMFAVMPRGRITGQPVPAPMLVSLGANVAASRGTNLITVASAGVKGAWQTIIDPVPETFRGLLVGVQMGGETANTSSQGLVDIGMGAAGSEVVILPNLPFQMFTTEGIAPREDISAYALHVPQGCRLAARAQMVANTGTFDVICHGVR